MFAKTSLTLPQAEEIALAAELTKINIRNWKPKITLYTTLALLRNTTERQGAPVRTFADSIALGVERKATKQRIASFTARASQRCNKLGYLAKYMLFNAKLRTANCCGHRCTARLEEQPRWPPCNGIAKGFHCPPQTSGAIGASI